MIESTPQSPELAAYARHLRGYLAHLAERHGIPGISLTLLANGHRLGVAVGDIASGVAPMPLDARFDLGRAARVVTSLQAVELERAGHLVLSAPVATYLRELEGSAFGETVRVEHLLADTCGFRPQRGMDMEILQSYSWERLVASLVKAERLFEPGTVFSMLLETRALLAEIIRRVAGTATIAGGDAVARLGLTATSARRSKGRVVGHMVDPNTGRAVPMPPFQVGDFWRNCLPELHVGTRQLVEGIQQGILGDAAGPDGIVPPAHPLRAQCTTLPKFPSDERVEPLPVSVGIGLHAFPGGWLGLNGPLFGQTLYVRIHGRYPVAYAVGANCHAPALHTQLHRALVESLGVPEDGAAEHADDGESLTQQDLVGNYAGVSGPPAVVRSRGDDIVCEVRGRQRVELPLSRVDGGWQADVGGQPISVGFFRCADGDVGLMLASVAYRKAAA